MKPETNTLPFPSTVKPVGLAKPLSTVLTVVYPPAAKISFTALLSKSATNTFPFRSTATPAGVENPLPNVLTVV